LDSPQNKTRLYSGSHRLERWIKRPFFIFYTSTTHYAVDMTRPLTFLAHRFLRTTFVSLFAISIVVGIAASRIVTIQSRGTLFWCLLTVVALFFLRMRTAVAICFVCLIGLLLGLVRGGQRLEELRAFDKLYGSKVTLSVRALQDSVYADKGQIEFLADRINHQGVKLPGKIRVRGFGESYVSRYASVAVTGKLLAPRNGSKQGTVSFSQLEIVSTNISAIETIRQGLFSSLRDGLHEPLAGFGIGLIVGQQNNLPDSVTEDFSASGLSHIVAVSGYNLTIIVNFIKRFRKKGSKYQRLMSCAVLIGLFLLVSGNSPSIVRAAWVSAISLLAWYYGRQAKPFVLVSVSAAITALLQPLYVFGDLGWYYSLFAFFGVLCVAPLLVAKRSGMQASAFRHLLAETAAAQLMTLPLTLYVFHNLPLYALLANVLVAPLIPLAMLSTALAALAALPNASLFALLTLPARYLLTYILDIAKIIAQLPGSVQRVSITAKSMYVMHALIVFVVWFYWVLHRRRGLKMIEYDSEISKGHSSVWT
jgi:competence protein ComEC